MLFFLPMDLSVYLSEHRLIISNYTGIITFMFDGLDDRSRQDCIIKKDFLSHCMLNPEKYSMVLDLFKAVYNHSSFTIPSDLEGLAPFIKNSNNTETLDAATLKSDLRDICNRPSPLDRWCLWMKVLCNLATKNSDLIQLFDLWMEHDLIDFNQTVPVKLGCTLYVLNACDLFDIFHSKDDVSCHYVSLKLNRRLESTPIYQYIKQNHESLHKALSYNITCFRLNPELIEKINFCDAQVYSIADEPVPQSVDSVAACSFFQSSQTGVGVPALSEHG